MSEKTTSLQNAKCVCGHSRKTHCSSVYGNQPRRYGECKICSCKQFLTLEEMQRQFDFLEATIKKLEAENQQLKEKAILRGQMYKQAFEKAQELEASLVKVSARAEKLEGRVAAANKILNEMTSDPDVLSITKDFHGVLYINEDQWKSVIERLGSALAGRSENK